MYKTVIIPHDAKRDRGGEDSAANSDTLLVVADGVSTGRLQGHDPRSYSRKLTESVMQQHIDNPR